MIPDAGLVAAGGEIQILHDLYYPLLVQQLLL